MSAQSCSIEVTNTEISQEEQIQLRAQYGPYLARHVRYKLHEFLRENTTLPSVAECAQNLADSIHGLGSKITTSQCRSPHACPLCTPRQMAKKREMIARALESARRDAMDIFHVTLTLGFSDQQNLKTRYEALGDTWSKMVQTAKARALRKSGSFSYVRILEETYSPKGWNPHFHVLFVLDSCPDSKNKVLGLLEQWVATAKTNGRNASLHSQTCDLIPDESIQDVTHYVTKHGWVDLFFDESKWMLQSAVPPLKLLQAALALGDSELLSEWQSFEQATTGRRRVTTSDGMIRYLEMPQG